MCMSIPQFYPRFSIINIPNYQIYPYNTVGDLECMLNLRGISPGGFLFPTCHLCTGDIFLDP